jgi:DNA-binding LacI/PurR family transcriptional regulator
MKGGPRRVTIRDIAERSGVSKATVSFAFNTPWKITEETRDRVLRVAEELEYIPDPVARTLATKRIGSIGLLLPKPIQETFQNPYLFEVIQGIGSVCHAEDLSLTILPPVKGLLTQTVRTAVVDAIITIGIGADAEILELIRKRQLPFVTIDGNPGAGALNVGIDDEQAGFELMSHVLSLGHTRIVVISLLNVYENLMGHDHRTAFHSSLVDLRLRGMERALADRSLRVNDDTIRVYPCDVSLETTDQMVVPLLEGPGRPTAVVCLSDLSALGVYSACASLGLSIPEDLSVAGFDGISFGSLVRPPLTTIVQPSFEKGKTAAELVLRKLRGENPVDVLLPFHLKIAPSTGAPPKGTG